MKTWMITGASSGIGRALAQSRLRAGDKVIGASRSTKGLPAWFVLVDLAQIDTVPQSIPNGRIDVLVNAAATYTHGETEVDDSFERVLRVNFLGAACLTMEMLRRGLLGKGSVVYNILTNDLNKHPWEYLSYVCSKAALQEFTYCLAKEYGPKGVAVCGLMLGCTRTPMLDPTLPMPDLIWEPEEVADFIARSVDLVSPQTYPWMFAFKKTV